MFDKITYFITHQIYRVSEYIGAGVSFGLYQLGIPKEKAVIADYTILDTVQDIILAILHGVMTIIITVLGFYIIHILKKVLEDKESRASKITDWIVKKINSKTEETND